MPRFFFINKENDKFYLDKEDSKHIIKSLRMKEGDNITICDKNGYDYECELIIDSENVQGKIISKKENDTEPNVKITLYQALPKSDKFETIVQKAVELGIYEIVPIMTNRCISRPDKKSMKKKIERYNKIAFEAAKQSGRGIIPRVREMIGFKEAVKEIKDYDMKILFYENGGESLKDFKYENLNDIAFIVGSEGGFDALEAGYAKENDITLMGLGKRILRCETAPIAALSALMLLTDNM